MSLRNRKDQEEKKLAGVNRVADPSKLRLGVFESLQNFVPAKRYKLKKKRGPELLSSGARSLNPTLCATLCEDSTKAGQATLSWGVWAANEHPSGNTRTSWAYMSEAAEAYTMVGLATSGGGNMPYQNNDCQINHIVDGVQTISPTVIAGPSSSAAINCFPGQADEPMFHIAHNGTSPNSFVYPVRATRLDCAAVAGPGILDYWVKEGSDLYIIYASTNGGVLLPVRYNADDTTTSSTVSTTPVTITGATIASVEGVFGATVTTNYLYILYATTGSAATRIVRYNRSDLTISGQLVDITGMPCNGIHAYGDDIIYLISEQNNKWAIYYWDGSRIVYVGDAAAPTSMTFSGQSVHFRGRAMYFGMRGFGGTPVAIYTTDYPCESGLTASLSTGASSVARGASISVTWAGVLVTDATDRIVIKPAPSSAHDVAGGTTLTSQAVGVSSTSGTVSVTIPGGASVGSYVAQYRKLGATGVYTCQSASFTVT